MDQDRGRQYEHAAHPLCELGRLHRWHKVLFGDGRVGEGYLALDVFTEVHVRFLCEKVEMRSIIQVT